MSFQNHRMSLFQNEVRHIYQIQYTNWPDHGVPQTVVEVLYLFYIIKQQQENKHGPLLVHCCDGVGRTGTFIALSNLLQQNKATKKVDVLNCVYRLREQRFQMVQTIEQYR